MDVGTIQILSNIARQLVFSITRGLLILLETFRYWTILNYIVQYNIKLTNIVWYGPIFSSIFQMNISSLRKDNSSMIYDSIWICLYIGKVSYNIVMYLLILSYIVWYCKISTNIVMHCHILSDIVSYFQILLDIVKGSPFLLDVYYNI